MTGLPSVGSTGWGTALNTWLAEQAGLPTHAGTHDKRYDAARNLYNVKAANTRKLRAGLAKARAGTGRCDIVIPGDSVTASYIGTGYDQLNMWPRAARNQLATLGVPSGGTGFVSAGDVTSIDPRWSFTGSWTNNTSYVVGNAGGATATFSTGTYGSETGTNIDLFYFGSATGFNITVDGAAPAGANVTVTQGSYTAATGAVTPGGGVVIVKLTVSNLSNATHNIVVTCAGGATYLIGANLYRSSGLVMHNMGVVGGTAVSWADRSSSTSYATVRTGAVPSSPDAVIIPLGINDVIAATANATITAALTTIRGYWPNADAILVAEHQSNSIALGTWQTFVAALYGLADTLDCVLFDLLDRMGPYSTANTNGLMGDASHPNLAGQRDWATAITSLLAN